MFKWYIIQLPLRLFLAGSVLYLYLFQPQILIAATEFNPGSKFDPLYILWLLLMVDMLQRLIPQSPRTLAGKKQFAVYYLPSYVKWEEDQLLAFKQKANKQALIVLLCWLLCHLPLLPLTRLGIIGPPQLILLSSAYLVADLLCILFFCPFQKWFIKCRCCMDCRIFAWDHFFMYTPLLFFKSFYSYSLFFTAMLLFLIWEVSFFLYPERFWIGSNSALQCAKCKEKLCRIKNKKLYETK
ncbi:MAG: hypothetical protein FWG61_09515 [Firmicutes bacterium]|nr:hypothetical protein [Bacillota bacterium]